MVCLRPHVAESQDSEESRCSHERRQRLCDLTCTECRQQAQLIGGVRGMAAALRGAWVVTRVMGGVAAPLGGRHMGGFSLGTVRVRCTLPAACYRQSALSRPSVHVSLGREGLRRRRERNRQIPAWASPGVRFTSNHRIGDCAITGKPAPWSGRAQADFPDVGPGPLLPAAADPGWHL